jgi:hypothetical protein
MKLDIPRVLVPLRLGEVCPKLKKALSPLFPTLIKLDIPRVLVSLRLRGVCPKENSYFSINYIITSLFLKTMIE